MTTPTRVQTDRAFISKSKLKEQRNCYVGQRSMLPCALLFTLESKWQVRKNTKSLSFSISHAEISSPSPPGTKVSNTKCSSFLCKSLYITDLQNILWQRVSELCILLEITFLESCCLLTPLGQACRCSQKRAIAHKVQGGKVWAFSVGTKLQIGNPLGGFIPARKARMLNGEREEPDCHLLISDMIFTWK